MYDIKCEAPGCDITLGTSSVPDLTGMVCENHVPSYTPEPPLEERIAALEAGLSAMMVQTPVE